MNYKNLVMVGDKLIDDFYLEEIDHNKKTLEDAREE